MIEVEIKAFLGDKSAAIKEDLIKKLRELGFGFDYACDESDCYYQAPDRDFRKTDEALRIRSVRISENVCDGNAGIVEPGTEKGAGRGLAESRALVTYKGPKQDSESHTRKEIELELKDPEATAELFKSLGYKPVFTVSKHREVYVRDSNLSEAMNSNTSTNEVEANLGDKRACAESGSIPGFLEDRISVCIDDVGGLGFAVEIEKLIEDNSLEKEKAAAREEILGVLDRLSIPRSTLTMKTYLEMLLEKAR
ncbi:MAG: class IV adenylate cyclase [Firmicutes bacterium]|nr:class IV adenylate cyclase [Bacillota bacterium]